MEKEIILVKGAGGFGSVAKVDDDSSCRSL